jgi:hypothetical protein
MKGSEMQVNQSIQQRQMFGCDPDQFLDSLKNSSTYKFTGALMSAASVLSDAQELMAMGDVERARQEINLAKLIIFEIMDGNLVANVPRQ